jgi:hypothetical protein
MPSITVISAIVLLLGYYIHKKLRSAKFPPGPRRLPIIGNLLEAPEGSPWISFSKWIKEYGPLVSLDFGGTNIILIGSHEVAKDLLDKRGDIYSDRPHSVSQTNYFYLFSTRKRPTLTNSSALDYGQ